MIFVDAAVIRGSTQEVHTKWRNTVEKRMSEIVRWYLVECTRRSVEPYYGFVEHIHDGVIRCDIDFAPLASLRLLIGAMNALHPDAPRRAFGLAGSATGVAIVHLRELSLTLGVNKHTLHPPKNSQQVKSFAALCARHKHLTPTTLLSTASTSTTGAPVSLVHRLVSGLVACTRRYTSDLQVLRIRGIALRLPDAAQKGIQKTLPSRLDSSHVPLHRFCQTLGSCVRLTTVDVTDTNLGDAAAVVLLTAIAPLPLLREVYLSGCDITDATAEALVLLVTSSQQKHAARAFQASLRSGEDRGAMRDKPSAGLVHLDISRNTLGDSAAGKIAAALRHDMSLQTLDIHDNAVTSAGCGRLMMAVAEPGAARQLRFLNLSQQGLDTTTLGPSLAEVSHSFSVSCESFGQLILSRALHPSVAAPMDAPLRPPPPPSTRARSISATAVFDAVVQQQEAIRPASATLSPTEGSKHNRQSLHVGDRASTVSPVLHDGLSTRGHGEEPCFAKPAGAPRASMSRGTSPVMPQGDAHLQHPTVQAVDEPNVHVGQASALRQQADTRDAGCSPWAHVVQTHPSVPVGNSVIALPVLPWPLPLPPWGMPPTTAWTTGSAQLPCHPFFQPTPTTVAVRANVETQTPEWQADELVLLQSTKPLTVAELLDPLCTETPGVSAAVPAPQDADNTAAGTGASTAVAVPVVETDANRVAIEARIAAVEVALASLAAAVEAQDGRLATDINLLKLGARMTKQQLQELSESVYSALSTVQGTARQLADERKQFAEAERAREAWLEAHPEELMERDVVDLIQMGIDRIRAQMRIDSDSPVPLNAVKQGGAPAVSAQRPPSSVVDKAVSNRPAQSTSTNAYNGEALSAFTDAVKRKLDALGWIST